MNRITKRRLWEISVLLLPLLVILIFPQVGNWAKREATDALRFPLKTFSKISSLSKGILQCRRILRENRELREKTESLKNQIISLREASLENERLRGLLSFKKQFPYTLVAAEVIGRDVSSWMGFIIVDKGSRHGIKLNMSVVSTSGLVGKVYEVGQWTSRVILITHPDSRLTAILQRSREEGIIAGTVSGNCRMLYLSKSCDVNIQDIVISSGLGGIYPKGLLIGKVTALKEEPGGLGRYAEVEPATNFSRLEEVLIITNEAKPRQK